MQITTERMELRPWTLEDSDEFYRMHADARMMQFYPSVWTEQQSRDSLQQLIQHMERENFGLLRAQLKASGEFVGLVGLNRVSFESWFTPCVEIGWRLRPEMWGQGLATEAAQACLDWAFSNLQLSEVFAVTSLPNRPSEAVMQRLGMEWVGEFDHPRVAEGHILKRHVVYRAENPNGIQLS